MSADSFVTADGVRLHVDAAGGGPDVVFQHGLCGDCGQTGEAFPPDAGFRRLTVEARGHGRSEAGDPARFSIARFAADVAEVIEQRIGKPVIVGGISMGAAMALHLAVHRPDLVRGLVLARPAWVTAAGPENMAPNAEVGRLLQRLAPEAAKAEFLAGPTGRRLAEEAPDNLASLTGFFSRQPIAVTAALLTAISADGPGVTETDLAAIGVPTLVIGHGRDVIHPLGHAETLAARIPGARLVEITPKAVSRTQYVADFHSALSAFLREF
ncbi:Pimeloyl-ACP methyl ester carboxylesterase [Rhizobium sp. RU20A]|uniref:alpha/beta fold hydrolase n=1 Tax=Rhizobium sp. RU20A TaxID=1907412 RepID=UPI0009552BAD|nr:alpha/beta hydrolase [Rhizobium sp. RU20A]SIR45455.1 Pimeloyl-ACP methyl ester carboxylesterase [Rhizobium sp. RU20A]